MKNPQVCPVCGSETVHCPECGKEFEHGTVSCCDEPDCKAMNAPLDCICGRTVSTDKAGVLNFDMELIPYERR